MIICAHTQEGEGLIERHARLFEAKTYSPGEDTNLYVNLSFYNKNIFHNTLWLLLLAGTNFSVLVVGCIWQVLILALL